MSTTQVIMIFSFVSKHRISHLKKSYLNTEYPIKLGVDFISSPPVKLDDTVIIYLLFIIQSIRLVETNCLDLVSGHGDPRVKSWGGQKT